MPFESFKAIEDVTRPDIRNTHWSIRDSATGAVRPMAIEDVHAALAAIRLNPTVPDDIQNHFVTARHVALYSWFAFRLTMVAQFYAYATLEFALRQRFGFVQPAGPSLARLLNRAIRERLVDEQKIGEWPGLDDEKLPGDYVPGDWLRRLAEFIVYFRNDIAHGTFALTPDGGRALRITADIINQLFPLSTAVAS